MKNPLTPAGIEPATFRFVAQHLNHCATAVPNNVLDSSEILQDITQKSLIKPATQNVYEVHIIVFSLFYLPACT